VGRTVKYIVACLASRRGGGKGGASSAHHRGGAPFRHHSATTAHCATKTWCECQTLCKPTHPGTRWNHWGENEQYVGRVNLLLSSQGQPSGHLLEGKVVQGSMGKGEGEPHWLFHRQQCSHGAPEHHVTGLGIYCYREMGPFLIREKKERKELTLRAKKRKKNCS